MKQRSDLLRMTRQKQRETIDSALDECIDMGGYAGIPHE